MPDFRSDTVTQPTSAMREAMFQAPLGDDVLADDPSVNALQEHAAELLGFEAALFAPSGTQTNLIALWGHCQRGDEAIVGQSWHSYRWEAGGMAVLGSIQPQPVETQPDGTLRLADIAAAIKPDDPHFARTRLVVLENTTGGQVLPPQYLAEVARLAREHALALHLDGARVFNAATVQAARSGSDVYAEARSLCREFDSVSLCLSKGLGAPVGSLLLGRRDFIRQARRTRQILGGGMRQAGMLAAAGHYALRHHVRRLSEDHANLDQLARGLAEAGRSHPVLQGRIHVQPWQTNILFTDLQADVAPAFSAWLERNGVRVTGSLYGGQTRLRWVTHLDVGPADVAAALDCVARFALPG
ncbi:low-specificity L-threonine aldolase [Verminephrobacter aporrectodeae]|uniref:Low-specificity L-threonine aldolase n=1 Tax=Verminephrobacter aporrectodeae subsp. tuberculatae TaxID=1110392 RepID=A0ABT3KZP1_9BURK|nr:low-specificity L-threonine aldolase [Verminephrobacter aporrectodeae]MCW5219704.1 low-specificity L-threonine aldolase [Verminephrobacter aporrectodeae subsp. tuberculatae]MCW5258595.1 low-specificity L-threonine aldolase [Verminephrobacter aporrectodeae subsp. tuberculatae]MCW5287598.1 low-specificity L-threonine aldolase [Verminephrobacter aporrectodeae subsp. tuberculatae]MCW5323467.1 low-specificity L-threonine aldolase [Verminephrobacter aporrectodeae subsp. tuberculatae]MCW8164624.1 